MQLNAETRNIFGKKLEKERKEGKLPAVLYGKKVENEPLFVDAKEFNKVWEEAGENTIIKLKTSASDVEVLIQDVDLDPMKNKPLHIDFLAVEMDKPITAAVPLIFEGIASSVKELGGVLVKVIHEIEVEALPKDLPHEIKIDISKLATFEDKIHLGDIVLPKGVKIIGSSEEVAALVELPREEDETPAETESIEEIKVEKKGKKTVEGGEGEAGGGEKKK
ncbi:MAG TPA: 50S ribosomal protein L25 [bacterium]|nr:50S ribosomal protein L25 [bacterium]